MKKITVKLDEQTVEISKLPIGKYAEIVKVGKELGKQLSTFDKIDNETLLQQLPALIENNQEMFFKLLSIATSLKEEEVSELGLHEIIRLVMAVVEVNHFVEIYTTLKKATARTTNPQVENSIQ